MKTNVCTKTSANVHRVFIHSSQNIKATKIYINCSLNKQMITIHTLESINKTT